MRSIAAFQVQHGSSINTTAIQQASETDDTVQSGVHIMFLSGSPQMLAHTRSAWPHRVEPVRAVHRLSPHARFASQNLLLALLAHVTGDVVVIEDVPRVIQIVQVPAAGHDDVVTLLHDGAHGRAAKPDVNDSAFVDGAADVRDDLLPIDGRAVESEDDLVRLVHRVLVGVRGGHLMLLHPLADAGSLLPAVGVHLVSTQMEEVVEEDALVGLATGHLADEPVQQVEGVVVRGIDGFRTLHRGTYLRVDGTPGFHVARNVDLGDNTHSTLAGVLHNILHVGLGVTLMLGVGGVPETRGSVGLQNLSLVIREMPVKGVELGVGEGVDDALHRGDREEVADRVDQHSTMLEVRRKGGNSPYGVGGSIGDEPLRSTNLVALFGCVEEDQLTEGFHCMIGSIHGLGLNHNSTAIGRYIELVTLIYAKLDFIHNSIQPPTLSITS